MEKFNLEEKKAVYEAVVKNLKEATKARQGYNGNIDSELNAKAEFYDLCKKEDMYKRQLTKARKEFAEAIMMNFEAVEDNPYEEKIEAKKERYQELADKNRTEGENRYKQSREMASYIPFGQPILVGHHSERRDRATRARIYSGFEKNMELNKKAEYYERKAETVGNGGISADDKNAILKLKRQYEKTFTSGYIYASAERRRIIDRVLSIYKTQIAPTKPLEEQCNGFAINRNTAINRIQLIFDDIPSEETRKLLKSYGFRWSPYNKAWQRQLNSNGEWAVERVKEKLAE